MDPPQYSTNCTEDDTLPAYRSLDARSPTGTPRAATEHTFTVDDKRGLPWLKLNVFSKASPSSSLPLLVEGEPIVGNVVLDLNEESKIKSVSLSVVGELVLADNFVYRFVEVTQLLWTPDRGPPSASRMGITERDPSLWKGKLCGDFSWSFSVELPRTLEINDDDGPRQYKLPASFGETTSRMSIVYRLYTTVRRGRLSVDYTVGTNAIYVPYIRPEPPSTARQVAYLESTALLGPDNDPLGWHTLPAVVMRGRVFNARNAELKCTVSLAKPLCYTRGSTIPVWMVVDCPDAQALDLLSAVQAPNLRLRRTLQLQYDHIQTASYLKTNKLNDLNPARKIPFKNDIIDIATAVWWPQSLSDTADTPDSEHRRIIQGEIHLWASLQPTSHFGRYRISYDVVLFPSVIAGFWPADNAKAALLTVPVEIATMYSEGPRPITYSAPPPTELSSTRGGPPRVLMMA